MSCEWGDGPTSGNCTCTLVFMLHSCLLTSHLGSQPQGCHVGFMPDLSKKCQLCHYFWLYWKRLCDKCL